MFDQARALDSVQKNSELFSMSSGTSVMAAVRETKNVREELSVSDLTLHQRLSIQSVSFVVIPNTHVPNVLPVTLCAISVRKRDITRKFVGRLKY